MRHKYRVAPKEERTARGRVYASKAERLYADQLYVLLAGGAIKSIEEQPKVTLGIPENVYIPDFHVIYRDGPAEWIDVKGFETKKFRHDKKLWKKYGPGPLRIVRKGKTVEVIHPSTPPVAAPTQRS